MQSHVRPVLGALLAALSLLLAVTQSTSLQAASTTLVIQEFRTRGPNGGNDEFIEIRNVSGGPINLSQWKVVGSDAAGAHDVRAVLPAVMLGPGCSWLLGNAQPDGYTGPVDQVYASGIPDDGGIGLQTPGGVMADFDSVGMSAGSAFGEGSRLGPLATNTDRSYDRVGPDSDDNAANFVLRAPSTPTRSADACAPLPPGTSVPPSATATASPSAVNSGQSFLLSAAVVRGANPTSTVLLAQAYSLQLGAGHSLNDTGTDGDAVAGDLTFSRLITIPSYVPTGPVTFQISVSDAEGRSSWNASSVTVMVTSLAPPPPPTPPSVVGSISDAARFAMVHLEMHVTPGANPTSTDIRVVLDLTALGGAADTEASNAGGGLCDRVAGDLVFTTCLMLPPSVGVGTFVLPGVVSDAQGRSSSFSTSVGVVAATDNDGDGLRDAFENAFGLDPNSGAADDGPSGDPDGDGRTNLQEQAAGTHPRGFFARFFAEGVSNAFFQTRFGLFDLGSPQVARTLVRVQPEGLPERPLIYQVPRLARRTLTAEDTASFGGVPFATVVESDHELVVDRTMTWGTGPYGSHSETAVVAPSTAWTLAEGATGWRFSLFYLLQNPNDQAAEVQVRYLRGATDPVLTRTYLVPARQRRTIYVDDEEFPAASGLRPLASADVSARIDVVNGVPVIVERSLYMSPDDQPFGAGHVAAGVPTAATSWFFAEGSTGTFFDEFILLANTSATPANVSITFMPENRAPLARNYLVAPNSRLTVWVDQVPSLEATALSATVTSDIPIVAERAMWWPGTGESWREAHVSAGATATGPRWAVADLELGGPNDANSFVLIHGGGSGTLYFDDGTPPIACGSSGGGRFTLHVNSCPGVAGRRFVSMIIVGNANTVVERVTYFNTGGEVFGAGGGALATRMP